MAESISFEFRERAEELYIIQGMTLDDVALRTGISIQSLKKWSAAEGWPDKRREYREAFQSIRRNTVLLRKRLIEKALKSLNNMDDLGSQDMHGFRSVLAAAERHATDEMPISAAEAERKIETPQDAIDALEEAVGRKLNVMLGQPGAVSLSGIKDVKKAMEIIDDMKVRYRTEEKKKTLLTEDKIREIREQFL